MIKSTSHNPLRNTPHPSVLVRGVGQRREARPRLVQTQCWCPRDVGCVMCTIVAYFFSVQFSSSLAIGLAIRTWAGRLTLNIPATINHASTLSAFTVAFTGWPSAYAKNTEKDTEKDTEKETEKVQCPRREEAWGARTNHSQ